MKKRKRSVIAGAIILVLCTIIFVDPVLRYRNHELKSALQSAVCNNKNTLEDIIPFDWDTVYNFNAYTSKEYMTEKMGFKSRHVSEIEYDEFTQLYFVKNNKVVAFWDAPADSNIISQIPEIMKYGTNKKLDVTIF